MTIERAPHLFRPVDNVYRLGCGACGIHACEHCADLSFFHEEDELHGCLRCAPQEWEKRRYFCIEYYFTFMDRLRQEGVFVRNHPEVFTSQYEAMRNAVSYLGIVMRSIADLPLAADLVRASDKAWEEVSDRLEANITTIPRYTFTVPQIRSNESMATVTITCLPVKPHPPK